MQFFQLINVKMPTVSFEQPDPDIYDIESVCALICNSLVSVLFLGSDNYFVMKHGTGVYLAEEDEIDLLQMSL